MLMGVLAIAGFPFFTGWYSKDMILAQALGFFVAHRDDHPEHLLLFLLPLVTAGLTVFYMLRMWLLTFTGSPRDEHVYEHARESPAWMTVPLIVLAVCSISVAWGLPPWQAEASYLGGHEGLLQASEPQAVLERLGLLGKEERLAAQAWEWLPQILVYGLGGLAAVFAALLYWGRYRVLDPAEAAEQFPAVYRFLWNKWYFDELYSAILVRPALRVAQWCRAFDAWVIDGTVDFLGRFTVRVSAWDGLFDLGVIDGLANLIATVAYACGDWFRRVQTGYIRSYVLFLVLAAIAIFFLLTYFMTLAVAG
jgi:NADH-quinone oxidoreductase subunit L